MKLYENIKKRRLSLNLSQKELAEMVGYTSRSSIAKVEKGLVDLSQNKIVQFANALKTTPADLMGWEDDTETVVGNSENSVSLSSKDKIEIDDYLKNFEQELLSQTGLMFDGEPLSDESKKKLLDALRIGAEMAKMEAKEKYTPKKYRK